MEDEKDELDLAIEREAQRLEQDNGEGGNTQTPPPAEQQQQQSTEQNQPPVDKPADDKETQQNPPAENQAQAPDYDKIFGEISGGIFKTKDDFTAALPKIKELPVLEQRVAQLQKELADNAFADDYEKKRNELKRAGASTEQLKSLELINDLGDLSKLDPIEAKVQKLILVDGYPEKVARNKVNREFPLDTAEGDDLEELQAELQISNKGDLEALQAFRAEKSIAPNDTKLQEAQAIQQIETDLTPVLSEFTTNFKSFGELNLNGEEGDKAITVNLDIDEAGRKVIADDIKAYFIENKLPVTQENYNEALAYARKDYLDAKAPELVKNIWNQAKTHFTKIFADKYENPNGVPPQDRKDGTFTDAETVAFKKELLGENYQSQI